VPINNTGLIIALVVQLVVNILITVFATLRIGFIIKIFRLIKNGTVDRLVSQNILSAKTMGIVMRPDFSNSLAKMIKFAKMLRVQNILNLAIAIAGYFVIAINYVGAISSLISFIVFLWIWLSKKDERKVMKEIEEKCKVSMVDITTPIEAGLNGIHSVPEAVQVGNAVHDSSEGVQQLYGMQRDEVLTASRNQPVIVEVSPNQRYPAHHMPPAYHS
jgi:hypothetical protein